MAEEKTLIVLVDDHILFRKGMVELINKLEDFTVVWEAGNGKEFIENLKFCSVPEILMLDIAMPEMNGYETAKWLKKNHPEIKVLVLSMFDEEDAIIKMLKIGINGYILKDAEPEELKLALYEVRNKGHYYSDMVSDTMASMIKDGKDKGIKINLNDREIKFLELICTEMTYKEIADKMCVSSRTIDGYRDSLFAKLNVKNRIGLVIYAIKNGIVQILEHK
jgi:two-component system, NarL family, invasion response regulator UvrY